MLEFIAEHLILFILTSCLAALGAYMRSLTNKINAMVTEERVKELIKEKLERLEDRHEATQERLNRIEGTAERIENKIDRILLAKK